MSATEFVEFSENEREFDAVLVGTGVGMTVLSSALSVAGERILHMDANSYYGERCAGFTLSQLQQGALEDMHAALPQRAFDSAEKLREIAGVLGDGFADLKLHRLRHVRQGMPENVVVDADVTVDRPRQFIIETQPNVVFSKSHLIDLMRRTQVKNYVQFRALDKCYYVPHSEDEEKMHARLVPSTKGQVFQSTLLTPLQKRALMRFVKKVVGDADAVGAEFNAADAAADASLFESLPREVAALRQRFDPPEGMTLRELLRQRERLDDTVAHFVLCSLAASPLQPDVGALEGLRRVRAFCTSVGRLTQGALLVPLYGASEVTQAFARVSALHRGTFALCAAPSHVVTATVTDSSDRSDCGSDETVREKRQVLVGVVSNAAQFVRARRVVASAQYRLDGSAGPIDGFSGYNDGAADDLSDHSTVYRSVCLAKRGISGTAFTDRHGNDTCLALLTVQDGTRPADRSVTDGVTDGVTVLQLDHLSECCPRGHVLLHLIARSADALARVERRVCQDTDAVRLACWQQKVLPPRQTDGVRDLDCTQLGFHDAIESAQREFVRHSGSPDAFFPV
ncbi:MAG: hypothetical protein MHM6MM_000929 [Cercozoa sp. M6MM]